MKETFKIRIDSIDQSVDDFDPEGIMSDGVDASRFLLIVFDNDGKPKIESMYAVSALGLAQYIARENSEVANTIRQADAIAEGLIESRKIAVEYEALKSRKNSFVQ